MGAAAALAVNASRATQNDAGRAFVEKSTCAAARAFPTPRICKIDVRESTADYLAAHLLCALWARELEDAIARDTALQWLAPVLLTVRPRADILTETAALQESGRDIAIRYTSLVTNRERECGGSPLTLAHSLRNRARIGDCAAALRLGLRRVHAALLRTLRDRVRRHPPMPDPRMLLAQVNRDLLELADALSASQHALHMLVAAP